MWLGCAGVRVARPAACPQAVLRMRVGLRMRSGPVVPSYEVLTPNLERARAQAPHHALLAPPPGWLPPGHFRHTAIEALRRGLFVQPGQNIALRARREGSYLDAPILADGVPIANRATAGGPRPLSLVDVDLKAAPPKLIRQIRGPRSRRIGRGLVPNSGNFLIGATPPASLPAGNSPIETATIQPTAFHNETFKNHTYNHLHTILPENAMWALQTSVKEVIFNRPHAEHGLAWNQAGVRGVAWLRGLRCWQVDWTERGVVRMRRFRASYGFERARAAALRFRDTLIQTGRIDERRTQRQEAQAQRSAQRKLKSRKKLFRLVTAGAF